MPPLAILVGVTVQVAKTVSESDVYIFAGITGDFAPNHINEQAMSKTSFGARIAHGALVLGYASACSTLFARAAAEKGVSGVPLSLGYDRVRFLKPVYFGDTLTINYTINKVDESRRRANAAIVVSNQRADTVAVVDHVLKWSE